MNEHLKLSHPVFSNRKKKTWKYFSLAQLCSLGEKVQSHIQSCPDTSRLSQMAMWSLLNYSNLPENYMVCYQRGKNRNSVFRQLALVESCLITFSSMCFYFVMGDNDGGYYLYHFFFRNAPEHPVTLICLTVDMACLNHRKIGILAGRK